MPVAKTLNERDTKLVEWFGEAHSKEAELEADLTAHISLTQKPAYKKRLQQHLKETRDHKRRVARRIKQLGGPTGQNLIAATGSAVGEVAGKTVSAVKGQVGAARALVTEQAEMHLRNAQEELREEHVEIALYTRIEVFATEVGDRETAQLARSIRRDEERMAKYLTAELGAPGQGRGAGRHPSRPASDLVALPLARAAHQQPDRQQPGEQQPRPHRLSQLCLPQHCLTRRSLPLTGPRRHAQLTAPRRRPGRLPESPAGPLVAQRVRSDTRAGLCADALAPTVNLLGKHTHDAATVAVRGTTVARVLVARKAIALTCGKRRPGVL
jgi:ferritin-like metal-binding protein YciE